MEFPLGASRLASPSKNHKNRFGSPAVILVDPLDAVWAYLNSASVAILGDTRGGKREPLHRWGWGGVLAHRHIYTYICALDLHV